MHTLPKIRIEPPRHTSCRYLFSPARAQPGLPPTQGLRDERAGGRSFVFERRWDLLLRLVVPSEAVDPRFDQDQTELRVFVLSVHFEVFSDGDGFFHEVPEIFGDGGRQT